MSITQIIINKQFILLSQKLRFVIVQKIFGFGKCILSLGMYFRQRICQSNNLYILCSFLLVLGFMLQIKVLHNIHQKNLRLQDYKLTMKHLSEGLMEAEKVANRTISLYSRLNETLSKRKFIKSKIS